MLLGAGRRRGELPSGVDSIHNYYEHLVLDEIAHVSERSHSDGEFLADTACVALNHLPPRYIRHDVDMTFFLSIEDLQEIHNKVHDAVAKAIAYVEEREAIRAEEDAQQQALDAKAKEVQEAREREALAAAESSEDSSEGNSEGSAGDSPNTAQTSP
ncbi:MAG: late competence development ComFB family protein [Cellvibrionaceae bacterium]